MSKPIYDPNTDYSLKILEAEKNGRSAGRRQPGAAAQ